MKYRFRHINSFLKSIPVFVVFLLTTGSILSCSSRNENKTSFAPSYTELVIGDTHLLKETLTVMEEILRNCRQEHSIPDSTLQKEERFYLMEKSLGNISGDISNLEYIIQTRIPEFTIPRSLRLDEQFSMAEERLWAESNRLFKSWLVDTIKNIHPNPSNICSQRIQVWDDSTQMSIIKTFDLEIPVKRKDGYPQEIEATLCTLNKYNQLKKEPFHLHLITNLWCWPSSVLLTYDFAQTWEECILTYKDQVIGYNFIRGDLRGKYLIEEGARKEIPYEEW